MPQTAADLLYLETVAEECWRRGRRLGGVPQAARPAGAGHPRRRRIRATCPRASGWRWRWPSCWSAPPPVLLLDEPTRGLDYPAKAELAAVLRRLADDGHAVMVATHDVEFAAEAADEVVVLAEGEVVSDGPDPRGARRVAGVRAPGHQDPRARLAARRRGAPVNRAARRTPRPPVGAGARRRVGRRADDADLAAARPAVRRAARSGPPFVFLALLPVVIVVVLAEVTEGGLDPRVLAVLGVLSAVNAVLRGLSPGTGGVELVFFLLILAGRVFGPGFGFVLGLHVAVRVGAAHRRGRAVAAVPDAVLGLGRDGGRAAAASGHRPRRDRDARGVRRGGGVRLRAAAQPLVVAVRARHRGARSHRAVVRAGRPGWSENLHRFLIYTLITSTGSFDTGRAITNAVAIVVLGPAVLTTLRRAARRVVIVGTVEKPLSGRSAPPSVSATDSAGRRPRCPRRLTGLRDEAGSQI